MKAAEIRYQKGLEAWLKEQPKEVCVWIAARAAARVLPLYWRRTVYRTTALEGQWTPLPVCRALLTASSLAFAGEEAVRLKLGTASGNAAHLPPGRTVFIDADSAAAAARAASEAAFVDALRAPDAASAGAFSSAFDASRAATHAPATAEASDTVRAAIDASADTPAATLDDASWVEAHGVTANHPLWPEGMPDEIAEAWQATLDALPEAAGDQPDYRSFWVPWYQGLLDGKPAFPRALTEAVALIDEADWKQGDLHINNTVIPTLMAAHGYEPDADGSGAEEGAPERPKPPSRIRTVRAQVATLQDFLDAEVEALRGHNGRSPVEDDILEVLNVLKALVEQMIERLDDAGSDARAVTVVNEDLPAIVEKTGELAVVEPEPQVSPTVMTMAATIKALVDAGGDPKLATQIAMGEAANQRVWPRILRLFGKGET